MPLSAGLDSGGLPILSYKLEWNQGPGGTFIPLVGDIPLSVATSYKESGLTTGDAY
jgi:hypothetical protein